MENYDAIQELVSAIKELSPLVWEAAEKQVRANVIVSAVWIVFCVVAAVVLIYILQKSVRELRKGLAAEDWSIPGVVFSAIGFLFSFIAFLTNINFFINNLIAPEYQTIKVLMDLVK